MSETLPYWAAQEQQNRSLQERNRSLLAANIKLKAERDRYKDALYHIGYRGADPKPAALEALGDPAPSPTEGAQDA